MPYMTPEEVEYVVEKVSRNNVNALYKIANVRRLRILFEIAENCNFCTRTALAKRLNLPRSTIDNHMQALVDAGLLGYEFLPFKDAKQGRSHRRQYAYLITSYGKAWLFFMTHLDYNKEMDLTRLEFDGDPKEIEVDVNIQWQDSKIPVEDIPHIFAEMLKHQGLYEPFHSMDLVLNQAIKNVKEKREQG